MDPTTDPGIQEQYLELVRILQYPSRHLACFKMSFHHGNLYIIILDPTADPKRYFNLDLTTDPGMQQHILQL